MTAVGFVMIVYFGLLGGAQIHQTGTVTTFVALCFVIGFALMVAGIAVWLWRTMP